MRRKNSFEDRLIRKIDSRRSKQRYQTQGNTSRVRVQTVYRNEEGKMISTVQAEGKSGDE